VRVRRAASVRSFSSFLNLGCTGFTQPAPTAAYRRGNLPLPLPLLLLLPLPLALLYCTHRRASSNCTCVLRADLCAHSNRACQHFVPRERLFRLTRAVPRSVAPRSRPANHLPPFRSSEPFLERTSPVLLVQPTLAGVSWSCIPNFVKPARCRSPRPQGS
jgi:hypothetical protein